MSVVVVGIEQREAPLDLLERVAVNDQALPKALASLRDGGIDNAWAWAVRHWKLSALPRRLTLPAGL